MIGVIEQVRTQLAEIVQHYQSDPESVPTEWGLVPFNDPAIGSAFVTENPSELLAVAQALTVEGGGDCCTMAPSSLF